MRSRLGILAHLPKLPWYLKLYFNSLTVLAQSALLQTILATDIGLLANHSKRTIISIL